MACRFWKTKTEKRKKSIIFIVSSKLASAWIWHHLIWWYQKPSFQTRFLTVSDQLMMLPLARTTFMHMFSGWIVLWIERCSAGHRCGGRQVQTGDQQQVSRKHRRAQVIGPIMPSIWLTKSNMLIPYEANQINIQIWINLINANGSH